MQNPRPGLVSPVHVDVGTPELGQPESEVHACNVKSHDLPTATVKKTGSRRFVTRHLALVVCTWSDTSKPYSPSSPELSRRTQP